MKSDLFGPGSIFDGLDGFLSEDVQQSAKTKPATNTRFLNELTRKTAQVFEEQAAAFGSEKMFGGVSANKENVSDYYKPEQATSRILDMITSLSNGDNKKANLINKGIDSALKKAEDSVGSLPKESYSTAEKVKKEVKGEG